jgi:hypothetical protein
MTWVGWKVRLFGNPKEHAVEVKVSSLGHDERNKIRGSARLVESIDTDGKMNFSDTVVCVESEVQPLRPKRQKAFKLIFLCENEDLSNSVHGILLIDQADNHFFPLTGCCSSSWMAISNKGNVEPMIAFALTTLSEAAWGSMTM